MIRHNANTLPACFHKFPDSRCNLGNQGVKMFSASIMTFEIDIATFAPGFPLPIANSRTIQNEPPRVVQ